MTLNDEIAHILRFLFTELGSFRGALPFYVKVVEDSILTYFTSGKKKRILTHCIMGSNVRNKYAVNNNIIIIIIITLLQI